MHLLLIIPTNSSYIIDRHHENTREASDFKYKRYLRTSVTPALKIANLTTAP